VNVNFTLTEVPVKPTPRPFQIALPHPFYTKENNSKVCVFVKDPSKDFKKEI
jgi:hypothetical protein